MYTLLVVSAFFRYITNLKGRARQGSHQGQVQIISLTALHKRCRQAGPSCPETPLPLMTEQHHRPVCFILTGGQCHLGASAKQMTVHPPFPPTLSPVPWARSFCEEMIILSLTAINKLMSMSNICNNQWGIGTNLKR